MNEQIARIMCIVDHLSDTSYCEAKGLKGNFTALELKANIRAAIQALAPVPAVPDGWKLVPIEPTEKMLLAYTKCYTSAGFSWCKSQWSAMLAAAPQPAQLVTHEQHTSSVAPQISGNVGHKPAQQVAQPYRGSVLKPDVFGEPKPIQQAAPMFAGLIAEHPGLQEEIAQQPLTVDQIESGFKANGLHSPQPEDWFYEGVRFAESHHKIGGAQ